MGIVFNPPGKVHGDSRPAPVWQGIGGAPSVLSQTSANKASQPPSQSGTDFDLYLIPLCVSLEVLARTTELLSLFHIPSPPGSPHTYAFYSLLLCRPD